MNKQGDDTIVWRERKFSEIKELREPTKKELENRSTLQGFHDPLYYNEDGTVKRYKIRSNENLIS